MNNKPSSNMTAASIGLILTYHKLSALQVTSAVFLTKKTEIKNKNLKLKNKKNYNHVADG